MSKRTYTTNVFIKAGLPDTEGLIPGRSIVMDRDLSLGDQLRNLADVVDMHPDQGAISSISIMDNLEMGVVTPQIDPARPTPTLANSASFHYIGAVGLGTLLGYVGIEEEPTVVISITGGRHTSKTTIAAMVREFLSQSGVESVSGITTYGDLGYVQRHLGDFSNNVTNQRVLIVDANQSVESAVPALVLARTLAIKGAPVNVDTQILDQQKQAK